nr:hypothetical protein [uncultured Agathobaculum sp.]
MKSILRFLPDALAACGAVCIVVALWMVSPVVGLSATGVALIGAGWLLARYGGADDDS